MSLCHSHNLYLQPHIISDTPSPPQPPASPLSLSPPSLLPLGPAFPSPCPPFLFIVASLAVRPRLPWRRDSFSTLMTVPRLVGGHSPPPPPPPLHQGLIWGDTANITHTHTHTHSVSAQACTLAKTHKRLLRKMCTHKCLHTNTHTHTKTHTHRALRPHPSAPTHHSTHAHSHNSVTRSHERHVFGYTPRSTNERSRTHTSSPLNIQYQSFSPEFCI